jgi:membrane fusion protein (multidrug efflux system)
VEILTAQRDAAEGNLKHAQAALEIASFELSYTRITAPQDGMVGERAVRVGAYVTPGSKLLAVVPLQQAYVVANFQETQLTDVQPGRTCRCTSTASAVRPERSRRKHRPGHRRDLRRGETG